jgi:hypothetical protein
MVDFSKESSMDSYLDKKAIVEVGSEDIIVHFFLTQYPELVSDFTFDEDQSDNNATAELGLVNALREELNGAGNTKVLTVKWNDIDRSLFVGMVIDIGGGAKVTPKARLTLDRDSAIELTDSEYLGFDFSEPFIPGPETGDVDKAALIALEQQASAIQLDNYTVLSRAALSSALSASRTALNNASATQAQVDNAVTALQAAIDGLVVRPANNMEVGKSYLVDVSARMSNNISLPSSNIVPMYEQKALVTRTAQGYTATIYCTKPNTVTVEDETFTNTPASMNTYNYNTTQSDDNVMASLNMARATESFDPSYGQHGKRSITIKLLDIERSVFCNIENIDGPAVQPRPTPARFLFDIASVELVDSGEPEQVLPKVGIVDAVKAASAGPTKIKLSWKADANADGYVISYRPAGGNKWKTVKVTGGATIALTIAGLKTGTKYYFRVAAYQSASANTAAFQAAYSGTVAATPRPAKASGLKIKKVASLRVKVSWSKVSGASGYEVWRKSNTSGWKKIKTTKNAPVYRGALTRGKKYTFKVRAFKLVGGKKVNGPFSGVKSYKL